MESDKNEKVLLYALLITLTFHMSHALITGRDLVFNKLGEYGKMFIERQFLLIFY